MVLSTYNNVSHGLNSNVVSVFDGLRKLAEMPIVKSRKRFIVHNFGVNAR